MKHINKINLTADRHVPFFQPKESAFDSLNNVDKQHQEMIEKLNKKYELRKQQILKQKLEVNKMNWLLDIIKTKLLPFVANFLVRWLFAVASGFFLKIGLTEDQLYAWILSAVTFIIMAVWSLIFNKITLYKIPPTK